MDKAAVADKEMSIFDHLLELRRRLIFSLAVIAVCMFLVYQHIPVILQSVARPVGKLVFLSPFEAFWVELKIAFFAGCYLAAPLVFYQVWRFVEAGLYRNEKQQAFLLCIFSFILFSAGAIFCYVGVIPIGVKFLLAYQTPELAAMISFDKYVSFVASLLFSFGMVFQMPLVVAFLVKLGIITPQLLIQQWRLIVVVIFIAAAVLTPGPDIASQMLMAGPLLVLYLISIVLARIIYGLKIRDKK